MAIFDTAAAGVLGALLGVWGTYLLGLLAPGPSFLAIGAVSALQGFRAALGLIAGIVTGSCLQVLGLITAFSALPRSDLWEFPARAIAAALLLAVAFRLWRGATKAVSLESPRHASGLSRALAGLSIGLCNPITLGGMTAQLLGPAAILAGSTWGVVAALGVATLGLARSLIVATLFSAAPVREAIVARRRPVAIVLAAGFAAMSLAMMTPLIRAASASVSQLTAPVNMLGEP